mgnify:CR=1 FL=1
MAALRCPTSTMTQYDSLEYAKRLEDAGVPKEQAAVHASVLAEVLSNVVFASQMKENTRQIRGDMQAMEARLVARIDLVRAEAHARIDTLEASLRGEIGRVEASLRGEIARVEASLRGEIKKLHWMFGTLVVMNIAIIAKLFFS